jgi:hypothetical protein
MERNGADAEENAATQGIEIARTVVDRLRPKNINQAELDCDTFDGSTSVEA